MLRNLIGVVVSALIVGTLYLGPAIAGLIWGLIPHYVVEELATPERTVVYDGAWEVSDFERDGDMDGTLDHVVDEALPVADEANEAGGDGSAEVGGGGGADQDGSPGTDSLAIEKPGGPVGGTGSGGTGSGRGRGTKRGVDTSAADAHAKRRAEEEATRQRGATRRRSRNKCPRTFDGIAKRKDGVYEVSRDLVAYHSSSVKRFNELGWSSANENGKGWYITGFGCRDALWHAGLRRKDIIEKVNGKKTNNMMQILMLYTKVKAQKHFTVNIRRNGKPLTLRYEVVKP